MTSFLWKNNAPFALCPTHDVDKIKKYPYQYLYYCFHGGIGAQVKTLKKRMTGYDPYWNFESIMELEDQLGIRSTFFFLNESACGFGPKYWGRYDITDIRVKQIIRQLDAGGWEIGLHGSLNSYKDLALLQREKMILEDILGKRIRSIRQHYLNFLVCTTLRIQKASGLDFDSTIGSSKYIPNELNTMIPYYPDNSGMLEIPITLMDTVGLEHIQISNKAREAIYKTAHLGGSVVLDWHQCAFNLDENFPRVNFFIETLKWAKESGAWIATLSEVGDAWIQWSRNI